MTRNESRRRVKMYSALEVANMCGVVNQTAINWIRNGYLKAFNTPGGQYRVIIDDDKVLNDSVAKFLNKNIPEMTVYQSFDGFDAGSQLVKYKPGFVILDIALPGVDGKEICKRIKTAPEFGDPHIIVITGLSDEDLQLQMDSLGADSFFNKPVDFGEILKEINSVIA